MRFVSFVYFATKQNYGILAKCRHSIKPTKSSLYEILRNSHQQYRLQRQHKFILYCFESFFFLSLFSDIFLSFMSFPRIHNHIYTIFIHKCHVFNRGFFPSTFFSGAILTHIAICVLVFVFPMLLIAQKLYNISTNKCLTHQSERFVLLQTKMTRQRSKKHCRRNEFTAYKNDSNIEFPRYV